MAQDGLIFRQFGFISDRFKTPVVGTLCAALLTSSFSAIFDLAALVNMLSIGVLLAYTVVAISIIILRSVGAFFVGKDDGESWHNWLVEVFTLF
jgi:amino acid transporter